MTSRIIFVELVYRVYKTNWQDRTVAYPWVKARVHRFIQKETNIKLNKNRHPPG